MAADEQFHEGGGVMDEDYLFEFYREFDHGLVLFHYGSCAGTRYGKNDVP